MTHRQRRAVHIIRLLLCWRINRLRRAEGRARRRAIHHTQRADEMVAARALLEWDHEHLLTPGQR